MQFSDLPIHHALLLTNGDRNACTSSLWSEVTLLSPAHRIFEQTILDIDTAREIISWAKTPYHEERVALISFHTAGIPAQNAMLKILEEPPRGTRFIIITSNKEALIPTVLSRVRHVESVNDGVDGNTEAVLFLKTTQAERMKLPYLTTLLDKTDEEGRKDRESVRRFILDLAQVITKKTPNSRYISETLQTASYASDPSASGKALIEYLSLLLPQIK